MIGNRGMSGPQAAYLEVGGGCSLLVRKSCNKMFRLRLAAGSANSRASCGPTIHRAEWPPPSPGKTTNGSEGEAQRY